jgi:hypothetical protein
MKRRAIPNDVVVQVLTEACAVPTCRTILAIDIDHIPVMQNGPLLLNQIGLIMKGQADGRWYHGLCQLRTPAEAEAAS